MLLVLQIRFLSTPDPLDPVVKSHYRMMRSFTAGDPQPLVPGQALLRERVCWAFVSFRQAHKGL